MNAAVNLPVSIVHRIPNTSFHRVLRYILVIGLAVYALTIALQIVIQPLDPFDESITVLGAQAVANGMTPHADFWTDYPALNYWIISLAFRAFGDSYFVSRFVSLAFYLLVLTVAICVSRNPTFRLILLVGLVVSIGAFYGSPPWNAFSLVVVALLLITHKSDAPSPAFWLLIGFLVAIVLLIRINFAAYLLAAVAVWVGLEKGVDGRSKLIRLACLCFPAVLAILFYVVVFRNDLPAVYQQLLEFPAHVLMRERILYLRPVAAGLFLLPFLLVARRMWISDRSKWLTPTLVALGILLVIDLRSRHYVPRPAYAAGFAFFWVALQWAFGKLGKSDFTVLLCYLLFLHYFLARADAFHFWPALVLLAFLVSLKLTRRPFRFGDGVDTGILVGTGILGLFLVTPLSSHLIIPQRWVFSSYTAERLSPTRHDNLKVELGFPRDGEAEALAYLMVHTGPGDYVYSGLLDHSRGYTNNLRSYIVLQRPIPVSDWEYEPGYSSQLLSQQKAIKELEDSRTQWLLLWHGDRNAAEIERPTHGATVLDEYLRYSFCVLRRFGDYEVWHRCKEF